MSKPKQTDTSLNTDLMHFYDNFAEFHDYCAFMCDALASLATGDKPFDTSSALGASRYCHWLKYRVGILKEDLKEIHEKAYTQSQALNKTHNKKLKPTRKKTRSA